MTEKTCGKCRQFLPETSFSRDGTRPSGLQSYCKECRKQRHHEVYDAEKQMARISKRREEHPEIVAAHRAVHRAVKVGKLIKGPCKNCGSSKDIQAHHTDYSKKLEVQWLCRDCHSKSHRKY